MTAGMASFSNRTSARSKSYFGVTPNWTYQRWVLYCSLRLQPVKGVSI